ncbi:MAG: glycogen/starch synthase [Candidatus Woesearchaeota archaeon]
MAEKPKADYLFEMSWEVCNKVGGIYTVVKSKIPLMQEYYKNYFLIGPYFEEKALLEFVEEEPPLNLAGILGEMKEQGVICHFGTWMIRGNPKAILLDFSRLADKKDEIKKFLWDNYQVDSLYSSWDFEEPVLWSWAAGILLGKIDAALSGKKVCQCHEWLAGGALLYLHKYDRNFKSIFTTHATILGRTISAGADNFYEFLETMNPEKEAYDRKIQDKFTMERACANNADVFTTVSEITAIEAEKILGKKPDVLLMNGLDISKFPTMEEISFKHITSKEKIKEYLTYHFFPYYTFDIENTLIFFICGRYELRNKGVDVLIKALGLLNRRLQQENSNMTIAVFFWIPRDHQNAKVELLENKNYYAHIRNYVEWNSKYILEKIVYDFVSNQPLSIQGLFTQQFLLDLKRDLHQFQRKGNPPICSHNIWNEYQDPIVSGLLAEGLDNKKDDKVKAIYYPVYMDGSDGLLNLEIYDAMVGCHLGIFPSFYEPWGYTPAESAVLGIPTITTDLSGFGRFIQKKLLSKQQGIFVLPRHKRSYDQIVNDVFETMHTFTKLDRSERMQNKINARNTMNFVDWKEFVKNYIEAHNMAVERNR